MCAHEHILTALQRLFTKAGYRTERKNMPYSRGMKKPDLLIMDFQLAGVRNVIVDVTLQLFLPDGRLDDLRKNKRGLPRYGKS
jgi:hypothetical protein